VRSAHLDRVSTAPDDRTTNCLLTASADTSVNEEDEGKAP